METPGFLNVHRACEISPVRCKKPRYDVAAEITAMTIENVSFVCNVTEAVPFCELLVHRNVTFLKNLQKFHSQHLVMGYLVRHSGKNELHLTFCNFRL